MFQKMHLLQNYIRGLKKGKLGEESIYIKLDFRCCSHREEDFGMLFLHI